MFSNEKKKEEFLSQLATKLTASSHQLSEAVRRLQLAELSYREYLVRLRRLDEHMRALIDILQGPKEDAGGKSVPETNPTFCEPPSRPQNQKKKKLRYADYVEFSNYAELKKFEEMSGITEKDIEGCNTDDLMKDLLDGDKPKK